MPYTVRKYLAIPEDEIPSSRATSRERQHQLAMRQKQQEVDEARKLAQAGYPVGQISVMIHHICKTIQNYLNPGYSVTDGYFNTRIPGKLTPYEKDVTEFRSKGLAYPQIHKILCEKGYTGSIASLRMFMLKERTLAKEFHSVMISKKPEKLDIWIESAKKRDIPKLQSFVEGISKDLKAIKNGIIYPYNNGLAEGSVNKIKVIKEIMYGRNSFALPKSKVLFHKLFHAEFN